VIKLEPNTGSYYCNNYSPDDPNNTLGVTIPVTNLSSGGGPSVMTSGHNSHQTISHTASSSSPGSDQHSNKRQRRLTNTDDSDKSSSDLQYYAQPWTGPDMDHVQQHDVHLSPIKIKQENVQLGQHFQCSQSPKEMSHKSMSDSHHRDGNY
jgi:hypothetical protein